MKYYVVADVHGFYDELVSALTEKGYFEDTSPHKLIVCGDLFDRGKGAEKLQNFIVDLIDREEVILIRGNHEDLLEEFVENIYRYLDFGVQYTHHHSNGTVNTVLQLTGLTLTKATMYPARAQALMRHTPLYKKILPAMRNYFETEHYVFVHGWIPCYGVGSGRTPNRYIPMDEDWRNASEEDWGDCRWYNGMDAAYQGITEPYKTIVCGHWHCSYGHSRYQGNGDEFGESADFSPYIAEGIIAIDGCTAFSHKVNCIVIEDEELPKKIEKNETGN